MMNTKSASHALKSPAGAASSHAVRRLAKGEQALDKGDYAESTVQAKRVLSADPNHLGALELLARSHWRSGAYETCVDVLRHLIRLNPYEPGYHFLRAGAMQALGHYGEAVRSYSRCLVSESETLRTSAAAAIRDLERWQEDVIAELIRSDRKFSAEYALEPVEACRRRGFAFAAEDVAASVQLAVTRELAVAVCDRPS